MGTEADKLRLILKTVCNVELDSRAFTRSFNRAFKRSLTTDPDEFSALIFAEIWSALEGSKQIDAKAVNTAIERVKSRLRRDVIKHQRTTSLSAHTDLAVEQKSPSVPEIASHNEMNELFENTVLRLLKTLDATDALIFEECVLGNTSVEHFAEQVRMSRSHVYRQVARLKQQFTRHLGWGGTT